MRLSVVIPTKDRPALLEDTLRSIAACSPAPEEVIVVDASATESSRRAVEAVAADAAPMALRYLSGTRGACRQRNRGIDEARGDVICFLDDDVLLEPDAFGRLAAALGDPGVAGATGRTIEPTPRRVSLKHSPLRRLLAGAGEQGTFMACGYPNRLWDVDEARDVEFLNGCFMAARADAARAVRFDEAFESETGYAPLEDEDFALRLLDHGRLRYVPDARVEHRNTGFSSGEASRSFNCNLVRNRRYAFRKSFPQTPRARAQWWAIMGVHLVHRALNGDWSGMRGLVDGLRRAAAPPR